MLKPPPDITVAEWAEQYRMVSETSPIPGKYRNRNAPHLVKPMECITDPKVRKITLMGSSQIGKTDGFINNTVGYLIDIDPCHIILMEPTGVDCKDYSNQKLDPMVQDTPVLKAKVRKSKANNKDNSTLRKNFPGGYLSIVSGSTPRSTRQRSARVVIGDDIDGIKIGAEEGDPVDRLRARTTTYKTDSLEIYASTPTLAGSSRIQKLYEQSNMCKYYVRCPHCGTQQYLKHDRLHWEKDYDIFKKVVANRAETVRYPCEGCGTLLTEGERMEMLQTGEWIPDRPWITDHWGFWINALSSTLSSMQFVAQAIIDAGDDSEKLESTYNTVLGIPYKKETGKELDPLQLIQNVDDFIDPADIKIPNNVLLISAAVDVQEGSEAKPQRLEVEVWGWGKGKERWLLYKDAIPGNIKIYEETWGKIDEIKEKVYFREDGVPLKISVLFVDSGHMTQTVYDYVRGREHEGIYAIKGANKFGASMLPKKFSPVDKGTVNLLVIGTQVIKEEVYKCLTNIKNPGPKFTHFPKCFCDAEYFNQVIAEHRVTKYIGTYSYTYFEPKSKGISNEAWDLMVYNYAAQEFKSPNYDELEKDIEKWKAENQEVKEPELEAEAPVQRSNTYRQNTPFKRNWVTSY